MWQWISDQASYPASWLVRLLWPVVLFPLVATYQIARGHPPYISDGVHQKVLTPKAEAKFYTKHLWLEKNVRRDASEDANHATVEFRDNGSRSDDCKVPHKDGTPCQLEYARALLQDAKAQTRSGSVLNVLVYIHGNENYAGENTDNYPHFRQLINCLNLGPKSYGDTYRDELASSKHHPLGCEGAEPPDKDTNRYIGVYLGWHGNTTGTLINLREKTARRLSTSPESEVVDTLYKLRDAAKASDPEHVRFIVFGHSFGGVVLEQSAIKIYKGAYEQGPSALENCETGTGSGLKPFADMMLTIAAAEHAVQAKKLVDLFDHHREFCTSPKVAASMYRPLMISFVAKHDFWSYGFGSDMRHQLGGEHERYAAPKQLKLYEPNPENRADVEWAIGPVSSPFQNICDLRSKPHKDAKGNIFNTGETRCDYEWTKYHGGKMGRVFPEALETSYIKDFYVRFYCEEGEALALHPSEKCVADPNFDPATSREDLYIANRTPFWIFAIDSQVFDDHGPFTSPPLLQLVKEMSLTFDPLPMDRLSPTPPEHMWGPKNAPGSP